MRASVLDEDRGACATVRPAHAPAAGARMRAPVIQAQETLWTHVERKRPSFLHLSATRAHAGGYDARPPQMLRTKQEE